MSKEPELTTAPPANWSRFLDQTRRDYETPPARGLAHGLQKEAVQNGWGARDGRKKWAFEFVLYPVKGKLPRLLTMTDIGTVGLIGNPKFDLGALGENESIPTDERLARFEAMFESGGPATGPGLFGRGKLIFNAASKSKLIYYDSLTKDGIYRFGLRQIAGRDYGQFPHVREASAASAELKSRLSGRLEPLSIPGTRITIVDPADEVVEAIESGGFIDAIEETWWEIILKHGVAISVAVSPNPPRVAKVPADFGNFPESNAKGWKVRHREGLKLPVEGHSYRSKKLHMLVAPPKNLVRPELLGLYIHRQGMRVGKINLSGMPPEIAERFFGYVFLDTELEEAIAEQENTTHYGFSTQLRSPYRNLKQLIQSEFDAFLEELGLKKPETSPEEQVRRLADDAQSDLNSILNGLGVPGFGHGRDTGPAIHISVENLEFPDDLNSVSPGDEIGGFHFKLENTTKQALAVNVEVHTFERDAGVIEVLVPKESKRIKARSYVYTESLTVSVKHPPYPRHSKIGCTCQVSDDEGKVLAKRTFYFFVDIKPEPEEHPAEVRLTAAEWPRDDSRRVDYGQAIKNLEYEIENRSPLPMAIRARVRTLWAKESNTPIDDKVHVEDIKLTPFQTVTMSVSQVPVTETLYQEVHRGQVNLRCHLVALKDTNQWRKGDRLAESNTVFWLNMDPAYGFWEDVVFHQGGPAQPRSEARSSDGSNRAWKLSINETHPAYLYTDEDEGRRKDYLFEEMTRQTIYVLLQMNQDEVVVKLAELAKTQKLEDVAPADFVKDVTFKIVDKVLAAYYGG
jgi:hypothetical protein